METIGLPKMSLQQRANIAWSCGSVAASVGDAVRVGVLMDGPAAPSWVHQTINEILRAEHLQLAVLIVKLCDRGTENSPPVLLRAWTWADRQLFKGHSDALALERREYAVDTIIAYASQEPGDALIFNKNDEARIKAANLDVIVNLASDVTPVQIKNCARFGVWTFTSGNGAGPDGDYGDFQDVFEENRISTLTLRAMSADGEVDLYSSTFSNDALSVCRNRNVTCWRKSQIFLRLLSDLYQKGWSALRLPRTTGNGGSQLTARPIFPGNAEISRFLPRWSFRTSRRWLSNIAFFDQWFIAYQDKFPTSDQSADLKVIIPPSEWSYADPFLYEHCGRHYVFFETMSKHQPTNEIWVVKLDADGNAGRPERALRREYNVSYPLVFEWQRETYLMPETSQNRTIEVYRAIEFPRRWELAGTLFSDVSAVDATLFERDGKLWLFAAGIGGKDLTCSELSLFYSDSLFGPWIPHPKNPIVCDVRRARPAGRLFYESGELIRPGQDCSRCYGYAISLNRIDVLSETDYCETPVGAIQPDWAPGLSATHTLNMNSRYEVLDGKCLVTRYGSGAAIRDLQLNWPAGHRLVTEP
jgi:hypothetical protein